MDLSNLVETPLDPQQKPYWQVLQEHQQALHDYPELAGTTVQQFAQSMGPGYEAGLGADNMLRRGSGNIDVALHHFGGGAPGYEGPTLSGTLGGPKEGWDLPKLVGGAVRSGAQGVGASPELTEKLGQVGEGFPRMAVDLGVGGALGGIPGMAAMGAASTYGETGSKLQAGISGVSGLLIPKAAEKVGGAFFRAAGGKTIAEAAPDLLNKTTALIGDQAGTELGKSPFSALLPNVAKAVGAQVGMFGVGEATEAAQNLTGEGTLQQKLQRLGEQVSPSSLIATGFAQLPWTVQDLVRAKKVPDLNKTVLEPAKQDFARRFTEDWQKNRGDTPDPKLVQQTLDRQLSGKPPINEAVGQTLQSIGANPVEVDMRQPVKTPTGDWPMPDAVQSVKDVANGIATARPELGIDNIGTAHDQRIYSALRAVEIGGGGKLSRDEMARQAAHRVIDTMTHDSVDLEQISPDYAQLNVDEAKRRQKDLQNNSLDVEIANKTMPDNSLYDPELHKRVAMLTGDQAEQQATGVGPRTELGEGAAQPISMSARDQSDPSKVIQVKDNLLSQMERDFNRGVDPVTGMRKQVVLTADATFAARRAAAQYTQPVDPANPESVRGFYEYVKSAVDNAQKGFNRREPEQITVTDDKGETVRYPDSTSAQKAATDLNQTKEEDEVFTAKQNEDKKFWKVIKLKYPRTLSLTPPEAGKSDQIREVGQQEPTFEPGAFEEGIKSETLSQFGEALKEVERNQILDQFHAQNQERDPAIREARKAALVQNVIDFVKTIPDSKIQEFLLQGEGTHTPSLRTAADRKAIFVKMMQFLRDGGDLKLNVSKEGNNFKVKGEGNLDALNKYLGDQGFKTAQSLEKSRMRGLNIFEQFHLLSKYLATEFINPDKVVDFVQRPRGDFAWTPPGFKDDVEKNLLVKWPKQYPKSVTPVASQFSSAPGEVVEMRERNGNTRRFESTLNPLATVFVKGAKHQLTISAGELAKLFKTYAPNSDKTLLDLVTQLTAHPFGRDINVGIGIAKDTQTKGYYHYGDDLVSGTGILLSPFSDARTGRQLRSVDRPEDVLPHLVHELAHAHTVFGYHNDPAIKAEVDEVYNHIKGLHDLNVRGGTEGKFTVDAMHGLASPQEMLATVFHDPLMQEYLKKIPDYSPRGGRVQTFGSVFDRIMDIVRRVFARIVGPDGANTMLQRVTDLTQRTMQAQEGVREKLGGIPHQGDIFSALGSVPEETQGDLVNTPTPQPVPKGKAGAQVYPMDVGREGFTPPERVGPEQVAQQIDSLTKQITEEIKNVPQVDPNATQAMLTAYSDKLDKFNEASKNYRKFQGELVGKGKPNKATTGQLEALRGAYDNAFKELQKVFPDQNAPLGNPKLESLMNQLHYYQRRPEGITLGSRVNKAPLLDSMKAASEYATEDENGQWFKPISFEHFRRTFGPIFGDRIKPEQHGDQWGYRASPVAFSNVTQEDLALAPKPPVQTWAPSAFEMMKSLFVKNGESEQNAEALAGYNLSMASLLKGTDRAVWGKISGKSGELKDNKVLLGVALTGEKVGALSVHAADRNEVGPTLRHEQTHLAGFSAQNMQIPSDVRDSIRYVNSTFADLSQAERDTVINGLVKLTNQMVGPTSPYELSKVDPQEFASEFMAHVGQGLGNVPNVNAYVRDVMRFTPDDLSSLLVKTTLRRAQALDGLRQTTVEAALQRGVRPETALGIVEDLATAFKGMGREAMDIAVDQAEFYRMRNLYPDMYKQLLSSTANVVKNVGANNGVTLESRAPQIYKEVKNFMGLEQDDRLPTKPSLWSKYLTQFAQFANQYRIARPFYDMLSNSDELAHQAHMQMRSVLAGGTGDPTSLLDKQRTKSIGEFLKSPRMRDMWSKMALDVQTEGDKRTKQLLSAAGGDVMGVTQDADVMTPAYMDALYRKYGATDQERQTMDAVMNGTRNQMKLGSAKMVESKMMELNTLTAKAIATNTNLLPEQAREVAKNFVDAVKTMDTGDLQGALKIHSQIEQMVPDPAARSKILQFVEDGWDQTKRLERFLSIRMPYFMSERRFGDYGLWWKEGDKVVSHYFKNGEERSKFIVSKNIDPIRQIDPNDKNYGVSEDMFGALDQAQARNAENLKALFGNDEGDRIAQLTDVSTSLRQQMQAQDLTKALAPRKGAESRKYLDMFDTQQQYVAALVNSISSKQVRLESELLFSNPEFNNQPAIKTFIQKHIDAVLTPDKQIGKLVSNANFIYFLGGNLSSMIMQSFHQLMGLAPTLVDNGATVAGSYGLIGKANKMYHEAHKLGLGSGQYNDKLVNDLVNRYRQGGGIQLGITSELDYDQDLALINRLRVGNGQSEFSGFDVLKNRAYQGLSVMRRVYNVVPHYNNEIGFVSALLHLREQHPEYGADQLYNEARFLKDNAMFPGGKSNRPGLFASGVPRSAAQAIWSLQTYANGLTTLMGNLVRKSFVPKGVTPAQAAQARKAAVQMMTTQMVFAGTLGFPFATAALAVLQKLFPDHNIEGGVRDVLAQLGGDDKALGGWLSTALTTGIPSAMSYAPDLGSRFALSGALRVSPYSGLDPAELFGPSGGIAMNVFKAMQAGATGKPVQAIQDVMPNGMRRIFQSLEQGSTYVSQGSGKMLVQDLTPLEQIARGIGFTPSRVARIMEAQQLAKVAADVEKEGQAKFVDEQATNVIKGDFQSAHQAITQKALDSKGTQKPEELARAVSRRVEEKTTPVDPRNFGSKQTVEAARSLKGALGEQTLGPSNLDRVRMQQQLAQKLGFFRAAPSARSLGSAAQLDHLLELYPTLTKPQASLLLSRATSASPISQELRAGDE